jgi:PAS domain S-box-containing protein
MDSLMPAKPHTTRTTQAAALHGLLLTFAAIGLIELLSRTLDHLPTLMPLLAIVTLAAFSGGLRAGMISAVLMSLYGVYYFSIRGHVFQYTPDNLIRLALLPLTAVPIAVIVGRLRQSLQASERQLRRELDFRQAIDQSLGEGVYALDRQGRVIAMNPAAEQLLGWTEAELRGQIIHDVIHYQHADSSPFPREECTGLVEVLRSGTVQHIEDDVFTRRDGTMFPVAYSAAPIVVDGQVTGVVVAFRDITKHKRSEDALRESEAKLQLIVAQLPAHIWTIDSRLRILTVLGSGLAQHGIDTRQYIGRTLDELLGDRDERATILGAHDQALHGEPADYDLAIGGRTFEVRMEPLRDVRGQVVGTLGLALDRTQRRKMAEELARQAHQQAAVADLGLRALAIPDLSVLMDEAAVLIAHTLNVEYSMILELLSDGSALQRCAGVGWKAETMGHATMGTHTDSLAGYTLLSNRPVIVENLHAETRFTPSPLLLAHEVVSGMSVVIHGQGHPFGVLGVGTTRRYAFSNDDAHFLQAVANVVSTAISRKAIEEQLARERSEAERLAELDRLRSDFIATTSHNLKTPLTAIQAGLGMIETSATGRLRADERQLVSNVRRNTERLGMLINDLLTLNQISAGALRLDREPIDLRTVVGEALSAVQPLIRQKRQALELDLPEPLPCMGDARRLEQVVVNLLSNAHQHTPTGTRIAVAGHAVSGEIRLSVSDTGPGVPVQQRDAIFDRFQHFGANGGGSGVGLAIVRGIIELHGGRIWLESAPRTGATFHVVLPRHTHGGMS